MTTTNTINLTFSKHDDAWRVRATGEGADRIANRQVPVVKRNGQSKHVHLGELVATANGGSIAWYEIARDETYAERRLARTTAQAERVAENGSFGDMTTEQLEKLVASCEGIIGRAFEELASR